MMATPQSTLAQEVTGAITGTVTDPSGAAVRGAAVAATDANRGTVWNAQSNDTGAYNFGRLPIGTYDVKVSSAGFEAAKQSGVTINLDQIARVDFKLKVGNTSETVEVTGATPILQTESTEVSTVIDANTAVSVPLAARNYIQLTLLVPGATTVNPQTLYQSQTMESSGRPYINGNREQANAFLLDGILNSEDNNSEVGYQPSPDAIQEFNVITQNASAEFGNYEGGIVSTSIKSGTNNFHGDVFEFLRNDALNANTWSAGLAEGGPVTPGTTQANGVLDKPKMRWNVFGATIGGPIMKNKLFFFMDYQGSRLDRPGGPSGNELFTPGEVAGNFGQLCTNPGGTFTGGICSNAKDQLFFPGTKTPIPNNNLAAAGLAISPVAQAFFNLPAYQKAAALMNTSVGNATNFFSTSGDQINDDQGDVKIDWNATNDDHVFFRWSQAHLRNPGFNTFTLADPGLLKDQPIKNATINYTHTFNPNLLNEFRIGFSQVDFDQASNVGGLGSLGSQIGITGANAGGIPGLPLLNLGQTTYGSNDLLQTFHTGTGELVDNVIISHGRHNFKTGFSFYRERLNYVFPGNNGQLGTISIGGPNSVGNGLADFWLGNVAQASRDIGIAEFNRRGSIIGFYGQDDWRVTDTLTLNLGLRFEDHTPFHEIHNHEVNFDLLTGALQVASGGNALYNNYLGIGDWLPRVGFAWSPSKFENKFVVRGAYGISSFLEGSGANQLLTHNWPFGQESSLIQNTTLGAGFGSTVPPTCTLPLTVSCFVGKAIKTWNKDFRPMSGQQWNLSVQFQMNNATSFQLGYVGEHGTHLLNFSDAQQKKLLTANGQIAAPGQQGVTIAPTGYLGGNAVLNTGYAGWTDSNANQSYNALQAVLNRRMASGLEGQLAYTYSKCITDSTGFFGTGTWGGNGSQVPLILPGPQNIYDQRAERGPCYWDQTHILSSYITYQLPFGHGKKWGNNLNSVANAVVGNWELGNIATFHSGNAVTAYIGGFGDPSGTGGAGGLFDVFRPNCLSAPKYPEQKVNVPGAGYIQWWDPTTFAQPGAMTFGTCSNGVLRGPRYADVDLSVHKDFPITEGKRLEFRSEFINLFNHPILDFAGGTGAFSLNSTSFGQINASQGERNVQFGLKFYY